MTETLADLERRLDETTHEASEALRRGQPDAVYWYVRDASAAARRVWEAVQARDARRRSRAASAYACDCCTTETPYRDRCDFALGESAYDNAARRQVTGKGGTCKP